jgi:hypothetical protein
MINKELIWEEEEISGNLSPTNFIQNYNSSFSFRDINNDAFYY